MGAKNSKPNIRQEILSQQLQNNIPYNAMQRFIYLIELGLPGITINDISSKGYRGVKIGFLEPHPIISYISDGKAIYGGRLCTSERLETIIKAIENYYKKEISEKEDIALRNVYCNLDDAGQQKQVLCSKLLSLASNFSNDDDDKHNVYCINKKGYNINMAVVINEQRIDLEIPMDNVRNSTDGNPTGEIYRVYPEGNKALSLEDLKAILVACDQDISPPSFTSTSFSHTAGLGVRRNSVEDLIGIEQCFTEKLHLYVQPGYEQNAYKDLSVDGLDNFLSGIHNLLQEKKKLILIAM